MATKNCLFYASYVCVRISANQYILLQRNIFLRLWSLLRMCGGVCGRCPSWIFVMVRVLTFFAAWLSKWWAFWYLFSASACLPTCWHSCAVKSSKFILPCCDGVREGPFGFTISHFWFFVWKNKKSNKLEIRKSKIQNSKFKHLRPPKGQSETKP